MKYETVTLAMIAALSTFSADASDWYNNVGSAMGGIEEWSDGSIWLSIPLANNGTPTSLASAAGSCTVTQIHLIPPAGKEKEWPAMILSASAAGKALRVFGDCVTAVIESMQAALSSNTEELTRTTAFERE